MSFLTISNKNIFFKTQIGCNSHTQKRSRIDPVQGFISLQNACWIFWLVYSTMCGNIFSIYGVHIHRKCTESMHFYSWLSPPLKPPGRIFWKSVSPRRKRWRKLWFAVSKFNQKIWRWPGTLVYLYFEWLVIFLNVMALQFRNNIFQIK